MSSKSIKFKSKNDFFINPKTNKIQYNNKCLSCKHNCKQSYKAEILACKKYERLEK